MPSRSIIRTGVGRIGSQGIASRPWRRRSISSPRERLAFRRDETSVDPSARSSITPPQSLDSIVRGRALSRSGQFRVAFCLALYDRSNVVNDDVLAIVPLVVLAYL